MYIRLIRHTNTFDKTGNRDCAAEVNESFTTGCNIPARLLCKTELKPQLARNVPFHYNYECYITKFNYIN